MTVRQSLFLLLLSLSFWSLAAQSSPEESSPSGPQPEACPVHVPNAFTPNGDNINETFAVKIGTGCEVAEFKLRIFDRWGRVIYKQDRYEPENAWNGQVDGSEAKRGVYMYQLKVRLRSPQEPKKEFSMESRRGSVVLIR